jgi:5'-nucleotidase
MTRPLVLLSNDDGFRSLGIRLMAEALRSAFEVVICAPDSEQSASSHALSLNRPLRIERHGEGVFSVDGTPADSVYVALHGAEVLPRAPDLIVSGMNHGLNLGQDVFYSGTVAAAREGALHGFPSLAVSAHERADREAAARDACAIGKEVLAAYAGAARLFNVNYPASGQWRKCATTSGRRVYSGGLVRRLDPRGRPYYWIGGDTVTHEGEGGTDTDVFDAGDVGVTPLCLDLSASEQARETAQLCARLNEEFAPGGGFR